MLTTRAKANSMSDPGTDESRTPDWGKLLNQVAQTGDQRAFKQVYDYFAPRLKAYAINQGMGEQSEELVQEVLTSVWRNAGKYTASLASVSTWIFTIARNQRIDLLRKRNRTKAEIVIETEDLWQIPVEDTTIRSIQAGSTAKHMNESINTLPEEQLIAVRKVYYEGKTHQEVAEELQVPLGTLKGRLRLSLKKLRVKLEATDL
ncbi:sigma-70 family RNA polymerase sigma factor [Marinimicrobium alkaliphilum]|uniref:sigma-70 family RNA polymerase sigma factor n=1 Tax=Marinimicrobium alkaliphilum TaxID=2202654 RepID=UPI001E61C50F|nr:sigma-70 family RNA polymerase sigma factor [Marinimicrobium alkaliphilum]